MAIVLGANVRAARYPINAGDLDGRVALLKPVMNEYGDEITGYTQVAEVWAGVNPHSGTETDEADRIVATVDVHVIIRYRRDIEARWRIQDGEHIYEVLGVMDVERRRVQLSLTCREVL